MAFTEDTGFKTGDSLWSLTRKILSRLNQGISTSGGGGGGGGGGPTQIQDGGGSGALATVTAANAVKTDGSAVTQPISNANLGNLDVSLSTRLKPADTLTAVTTVGTITNPVTVAQATAANLKVDLSGTGANATALKVDGSAVTQPVSGNVGGKTAVIKANPTISTSAYSAGFTVGAIQTLANAFTSQSTGILESLILLDKSNQKAPMDILLFDANPTNATTTDHATFVISTDDLKVIGRVSVAAGDYVTIASGEAVAIKTGLGIALKAAAAGTTLYAVAITSGTPTYSATALQWVWGILQD
jgi:hypothetical protein